MGELGGILLVGAGVAVSFWLLGRSTGWHAGYGRGWDDSREYRRKPDPEVRGEPVRETGRAKVDPADFWKPDGWEPDYGD